MCLQKVNVILCFDDCALCDHSSPIKYLTLQNIRMLDKIWTLDQIEHD